MNELMRTLSRGQLNTLSSHLNIATGTRRQVARDARDRIHCKRVITSSPYSFVAALGVPGRDGMVYHVKTIAGKCYAMKIFVRKKSKSSILKEISNQGVAAAVDVAPKIVDHNMKAKYIVMEILPLQLHDYLIAAKGTLSTHLQRSIIRVFRKLDGVLHQVCCGHPGLGPVVHSHPEA